MAREKVRRHCGVPLATPSAATYGSSVPRVFTQVYHVPMPQTYATHRRTHPVFHRMLMPIVFLTLIGSGVNLYESWGDHSRYYSASLIFVLTLCLGFTAVLAREFALKAQDRAIKGEENFRHYLLAGDRKSTRLNSSHRT